MNFLPKVGEYVRVEYLVIDELEAMCWLTDYNLLGYLDNHDMFLKLSDTNQTSYVQLVSIDNETGRIELKR